MTKEEFITMLTQMSKEEIKEFIANNGKKAKKIVLVTPINNTKY